LPEEEPAAEEENAATSDPWEDLDLEAEVVDLNHQRIGKIDERIQQLSKVEVLTFRWNHLKTIENIQTLITLKEVEFYDNQISEIENLDALVNLE
jgi:Leucine-rich repeat (LRR) protein